MKTSFLKITVLAAMLIGFFSTVNAQGPYLPGSFSQDYNQLEDPDVVHRNDADMISSENDAGADAIDTVTLDGQYLYAVNSYYSTFIEGSAYAGFYTGADFKWDLYAGAFAYNARPGSGELTNIFYAWGGYVADGTTGRTGLTVAADPTDAANGWVQDSTILIDFESAAPSSIAAGQYSLFTSEQLIGKQSGFTTCPSNDTVLAIQVVPAPTFTVTPDTVGGCEYHNENSGIVPVPVNVTGAGPFEVSYTVRFASFDGTNDRIENFRDTLDVSTAYNSSTVARYLSLSWGTTTETSANGHELGGEPDALNEYGVYTVYIDFGVDRFSNKAMNLVAPTITQGASWTGNPTVAWADTNYPTSGDADPFYIVNFPTPDAEPIRHITNTYHNN